MCSLKRLEKSWWEYVQRFLKSGFSILQVQFDFDIDAKWIFQKVLR